jgi:hypothetical protein
MLYRNFHLKDTPLPEGVRQASPDISSAPSFSAGPPTGPPKAHVRTYNPVSNPTLHQTNASVLSAETSAPTRAILNMSLCRQFIQTETLSSYNLERKFSSPETTRSHTPRSSSIGSNSSLPKSEKARSPSRVPSNTSPSMVPLPYLPCAACPSRVRDLNSSGLPKHHYNTARMCLPSCLGEP